MNDLVPGVRITGEVFYNGENKMCIRDRYAALDVEEDEALAHAARHRLELAAAAGQLVKLAAYLTLLPLHAGQQRGELVVGVVFQRVVQVLSLLHI